MNSRMKIDWKDMLAQCVAGTIELTPGEYRELWLHLESREEKLRLAQSVIDIQDAAIKVAAENRTTRKPIDIDALECFAFASTNRTPEIGMYKHWFRKGVVHGMHAAREQALPHLSHCSSLDDTMENYPRCDCGARRQP